jgi:hypothetical protein
MNKPLLPLPWEKNGVAILPGERNIIKKAGLQWTIEKGQIKLFVLGQEIPSPDGYALARMPERLFLDTCGKRYQPTQNVDLFRFWRLFLSNMKLNIDWAGTAHNCNWVWAIAKTKYGFSVGTGKDTVDAYIMLAHPHFCGESQRCYVLLVRNANMSVYVEKVPLLEGKQLKLIEESEWCDADTANVKKVLDAAKKLIHEVEIKCAALVDKTISEDQAKRYFTRISYSEARIAKFLETPESTLRMLDCFRRGPGADMFTTMNSWWGAYQAAAYYLDRIAGRDPEHRFFSSIFGPRAEDKRRALDMAYATVTT